MGLDDRHLSEGGDEYAAGGMACRAAALVRHDDSYALTLTKRPLANTGEDATLLSLHTADRGRSLIVSAAPDLDQARRDVVAGWARAVGYRIVFFDEPLGIAVLPAVEPARRAETTARSTCNRCGGASDGTGDLFWAQVLRERAFPVQCPRCDEPLVQPIAKWPDTREEAANA